MWGNFTAPTTIFAEQIFSKNIFQTFFRYFSVLIYRKEKYMKPFRIS